MNSNQTTSAQVLAKLIERQQTIVTAESCTGGLIAVKITDVPGASQAFLGGVVSYSDASKVEILCVTQEALVHHGAVSEQVAALMAQGVRHKFRATWAVSATGIAGPSGGAAHKPVGMLCVGLSGPNGMYARTHNLPHLSREQYREKACEIALSWLLSIL